MSKEIKSVETVFRALLECAPWRQDHNVIEMPWRAEKDNDITRRGGVPRSTPGRLVFGMMTFDGNVRPSPPIKRALTYVRRVLAESGHEIVDWNPPRHDTAVENLVSQGSQLDV
jgi:amidase